MTESGGCVIPAQPGTISGSTSVCSGSTQVYSVASVAGATSYVWSLPNGWSGTSSGNSINVTAGNTSGLISVAAQNACGTSTASTVNVTANSSATPSISVASNSSGSICTGTSVTFLATATNGGTAPVYQWKVNGVNTGANSSTYITNSLANGDLISCVLTSTANCLTTASATSNTIVMAVTSSVVPVVSIASNATSSICAGDIVTFTASPVNGGASPTYQWKVNGLNVGNNSITYTTGNLVNGDIVTVQMTSSAACASTPTATSNSVVMSVTASVTPSVSISANPGNNICNGTSVSFTAVALNGGSNPIYQWTVNGVNVGLNNSTFTSASLLSGDVVSCELTSSVACVTSSIVSSNLISMVVSATGTPNVTISANPGTTICLGSTVVFTAAPANGGATPTYQWMVNGVIVGTNTDTYSSNSIANGDQIQCVMTSSSNCVTPVSATSSIITMSIGTNFTPTITANGSLDFCDGGDVILSATAGDSYTWSPGGQTTQSITVNSSGTYAVQVVSGGCTGNSSATTVSVLPLPAVTISTVPPVCVTDSSFPLTVGSPAGGVYAGTGVSAAYFDPAVAGVGSAIITYTITDSIGCSNATSTSIVVNNCSAGGCTNAPDYPGRISGPNYITCLQGQYIYSVPLDSNATTYNWTLPSGWVILQDNGNAITIDPGLNFNRGYICVEAVNTCGTSASSCRYVRFGSLYLSSLNGPEIVCKNDSAVSYSVRYYAGATYAWSVSDNASLIINGNSILVDYSNVTSSQVIITVTITDACGNSSTKDFEIYVKEECGEDDNGHSDEDHDDRMHSIMSAGLFPNPTCGIFNLQIESNLNGYATIYIQNLVGQECVHYTYSLKQGFNDLIIDAINLTPGVYFMRAEVEGFTVKMERFVIQR